MRCKKSKIQNNCFCLQKAEKSVRFYKNISESNGDNNKVLDIEIDKLKAILADARRQSVVTSHDTSLKWSDFKTKAARKAMVIGIVLVIICMLNGVTTYYTGIKLILLTTYYRSLYYWKLFRLLCNAIMLNCIDGTNIPCSKR